MRIVIPIAPITKKNSQRIVQVHGRPLVLPSQKYKEYEAACRVFIPKVKEPFSDKVNVRCHYYMPTHRKCDLVNLEEATLDVLVKYGILADDNYSVVWSMDGSRVFYDKEHPRTEIEIEEVHIMKVKEVKE